LGKKNVGGRGALVGGPKGEARMSKAVRRTESGPGGNPNQEMLDFVKSSNHGGGGSKSLNWELNKFQVSRRKKD